MNNLTKTENLLLTSFTPNLMSIETLEAIFVQRHKLITHLIEATRDNAETASKHFNLLVGKEGLGKTHIITLIYHRLKNTEELSDKLLIAWLNEEEWGVNSWLSLLLRIFRALEVEYPKVYKEELEKEVESLYNFSLDDATYYAERLLKEFIGDNTLLLLAENLDKILKGLKDIGQKQFRAYLQNNNFITVVGSSRTLPEEVSNHNFAFYGFFSVYHLEPLNFQEVTELLVKIALLKQDKDVVTFIQSCQGEELLKLIYNLVGGNHRFYLIFSQFLTNESLKDLNKPLTQALDQLIPFYKFNLQLLSPQQKQIIGQLVQINEKLSVTDIAQRCFITHQTASSQLKTLRNLGYVKSTSVGRKSFYELEDPLMKSCLKLMNGDITLL